MPDDQKVILELDLDDADYVKKMLRDRAMLKEFGKGGAKDVDEVSKSFGKLGDELADAMGLGPLKSFTGNMLQLGAVVGAVGVAAYGLKAAFGSALEGEKLNVLNEQFEQLTKNVGIASGALRRDFVNATQGLIGEDDALQLANQAVLRLGKSAESIPQIMDLARKSVALLGGSVDERFQQMVQAISSGRAEGLRALGLTVDTDAAMRKYATSLGVTTSSLSEAGKKQAILNAALESGRERFKGIDSDVQPLANGLARLKVAWNDTFQNIALITNRVLGPAFQAVLQTATNGLKSFTSIMNSVFGSGAAKAAGDVDMLENKLKTLQARLEVANRGANSWFGGAGAKAEAAQIQAEIDKVTSKLESARANAKKLESESASSAPGAAPGAGGVTGSINYEAQKAQEAKFLADIRNMRAQAAQTDVELAANRESLEQAQRERLIQAQLQFEAQIAQLATNKDLTEAQRLQTREQLEVSHQQRLLQIQAQANAEQEKMLDNYQKKSTTVLDGIARAAQVSAQKNMKSLTDPQIAGQMAFDNLQKLGFNAFDALGRGAVDGSNQIGKAMLSTIGQIASQYGQMMVLAGIFPPNPVAIAAGAALIALGGYLGGKASQQPSVGGSTTGAPQETTAPTIKTERDTSATQTLAAPAPAMESEVPRKSVTLVVQGNIYQSDQTKQELMRLIREASDATDFQYRQIGE